MSRKLILAFILIYLPFVFCSSAIAEGADTKVLEIQPTELSLGMFYGGGLLKVKGNVSYGIDLAVVCSGKPEQLVMKRKEKVAGILWMNREEVIFKNVPQFFAISTSRATRDLASQEELKRLGILFADFSVERKQPYSKKDTERLISELTKLKKKEHLFISNESGIAIQPRERDREFWSTVIQLPSKLLPGSYRVRLFGFRNQKGMLLDSKILSVRQVGMTAFINSLAEQHGLLYGFVSVVIALLVGLLTGLVFGLGSKGGH